MVQAALRRYHPRTSFFIAFHEVLLIPFAEVNAVFHSVFSINNAPHYVLARGINKYEVAVIPHVSEKDDVKTTTYGKISLKACVEAICRSR